MDWFYKEDNAEVGPLDDEAFATRILDGRITLGTPVWHVDMKEWVPLSEVIKQEGRAANHEAAAARNIEEAFDAPAPGPDSHASSTRAKIPDPAEHPAGDHSLLPPPEARAAVQTPANRLKMQPRTNTQVMIPNHLVKVVDEGTRITPAMIRPDRPEQPAATPIVDPNATIQPPGALPPPPFFRRLCADVTDIALAAVLAATAAWLAPASIKTGDRVLFFVPGVLILSLLPHALSILALGATPGLLAMRLRLRTDLGERCAFSACLAYPFGLLLSTAPLGLGLLTAILTSERRPLHDMIAGTRVE